MVYMSIACALSCRVFCMVLLCERELGARSAEIQTEEVEGMLMAVMAR